MKIFLTIWRVLSYDMKMVAIFSCLGYEKSSTYQGNYQRHAEISKPRKPVSEMKIGEQYSMATNNTWKRLEESKRNENNSWNFTNED